MKFTLGFLVCCFLVIVGTVIFAPEYAHEIIDRFHDKSTTHTTKPQVTESNNENSNSIANKGKTFVSTSESVMQSENENGTSEADKNDIIVATSVPVIRMVVESENEHSNSRDDNAFATPTPAFPTQTFKRPQTEQQLLGWLKAQGYRVEEGQEFYRISWQMQKPTSSKPVSICLKDNGTIIPNYGRRVVSGINFAAGRKATINGYTITTSHGGVNYTLSNGGIDIALGSGEVIINTTDKITITSSAKYENSSWWIETMRSFLWVPGRDNIEDVRSKAKKIKNN